MYGEAYLRKGLIPHVATTLEEYLWLASQVPDALLTATPPGGSPPVRAQVLDLALDLDVRVYPALLALLDARDAPPVLDSDTVAARRRSWGAAEWMVALKQIRYRFQATESLLTDTPEAVWGHPTGRPTPLARAVFALWQDLLQALARLARTVAALELPAPRA